MVCSATNILVSDGYVARQAAPSDLNSFKLTEAGEQRLLQEQLEVPQEEMLVIDYDGTRRVPVRLSGTSVLRASELKAIGAVEIRPYPAEPPDVSELQSPEVTRVIRRQGGEDFRRTVLERQRVVRRSSESREAVALVFAADKGDEVQIAFAIDGKLSDAYERAFAERGRTSQNGLHQSLGRRRREKEARTLCWARHPCRLPGSLGNDSGADCRGRSGGGSAIDLSKPRSEVAETTLRSAL